MEFFENLFDEWKPISRTAGISWLVCYFLFLTYALADTSKFLFLDYVNLMIHEGGHLLFSPFGYTITILGGTLGELLAPLSLGGYFFWQREVAATAFCSFWFFENFLYIGVYMADARAEALQLVGGGEHDWNTLFGQWGLIMQDQKIGEATRVLGWIGMLATMAWLGWRTWAAWNAGHDHRHYLT